jgi:hypothetical protein
LVIKIISIFIGLLILCQILIAGCDNSHPDYSTQVAVAQKNVPFKIVIPSYFPPELQNHPISISPPDNLSYNNSTLIGIRFYKNSSHNYILIYEENHLVGSEPSRKDNTYLNISGVKILEEYSKEISKIIKYSEAIDIYYYRWNQKDIHIDVQIGGISQNECRKIIESMVNQ